MKNLTKNSRIDLEMVILEEYDIVLRGKNKFEVRNVWQQWETPTLDREYLRREGDWLYSYMVGNEMSCIEVWCILACVVWMFLG